MKRKMTGLLLLLILLCCTPVSAAEKTENPSPTGVPVTTSKARKSPKTSDLPVVLIGVAGAGSACAAIVLSGKKRGGQKRA